MIAAMFTLRSSGPKMVRQGLYHLHEPCKDEKKLEWLGWDALFRCGTRNTHSIPGLRLANVPRGLCDTARCVRSHFTKLGSSCKAHIVETLWSLRIIARLDISRASSWWGLQCTTPPRTIWTSERCHSRARHCDPRHHLTL